MYTAERITSDVPTDQLGIGDKLAFLATYSRYFLSVTINAESRLADSIHQELDGVLKVGRLDAAELTKHDVVALIGHGFGLRGLSDLKPLESFVADCPVRPSVIVEAAEQLSEKKLRQLFVVAERLGLGLLLFGSKPLRDRKACAQFHNQILHTTTAKLSAGDVRQLVRQRFSDVRLSENQVDDLVERSHGELNNLEGLVDELVAEPPNQLGVPMVHMSGLVVLAVVLVGGWWSLKGGDVQSIDLAVPSIQPVEIQSSPQVNSVSNVAVSMPEQDEPIPLVQEDPNAWVNTLPATAAGTLTSTSDTTKQGAVPESDINPRQVIDSTAELTEPSQNTWLQTAPLTAYTLQLMGSHDRLRVLKFIESQGNGDEFGYFETKHRNQAWFVLTVGQFQDRDQALAAVANLAPQLKAQKPWARSVASIRGE